jgi:diguanylate cyclase (GGDEF)-like protein
VVLEKTPQCLLGISFWSETEELDSHLSKPFFNELFSLISLILLRVLYHDLLEHTTAQQKLIEQLTTDGQQKKAYEALLRHQATYDHVTNLPNRFYGYSQLERAITSAQKNQHKLAILFLDLDEFKQINDSMSHMAGDMLLKILAERYLALMRSSDTLVRLGGDEFMIILEDLNYDKYVEDLAQKCQESCLLPFKLEAEEVVITSSIGIALYPEHGPDAKTLMRNADAAMYQSKLRGKNNWTIFIDTMGETAANHIRIKTELRQVLNRDELYISYQPIINIRDESVVAVEALLRWDNSSLGSVTPEQIITIAEETGLIVPLGYWILKKVCADIKELQAANINIKVAVNVSALQLKQKDFVDQVSAILQEENISPGVLIFEITESAFIDDSTLILSQLKRLKEMSIDCSLDDFGMGYSSLNYIRCYPFSSLKIDRAFIQRIETRKDDLNLVNGIIMMSHNLKLSVIAEGIETKKQYDLLQSMGCDMVQGWYFSKALNKHELLYYLRKKGVQPH